MFADSGGWLRRLRQAAMRGMLSAGSLESGVAMPDMPPVLLAGSASVHLVAAVERTSGLRHAACAIERFPDGEVSVRLDEGVRGRDVIILAATAPPVNDHLVELLAIADTCRRADAARIVAVIPYFGYARSDRRDGRRTPIMASLVAMLIERAGIGHVVTIDAHTPALEGFFRIPVDNLSAVPLLARAIRDRVGDHAVVAAPDLGATRLATRYAAALQLPVAICHKRRMGGAEVSVELVTGDVRGRRCIIVDDMISTGATIVESVRALREAGAEPEPVVVATHAVFAPSALERLADAGVRELLVSDTIEPRGTAARLVPTVASIAPLVATAIGHLTAGGSLRELA
ncbi:MAG TPA: ribose-phosphate pyrophosphokinase [Gemmatimonadaceae bacterium]|nr:ribose-phosphate pyrophosphokinase [Gemmatimonadaceae bacterium]